MPTPPLSPERGQEVIANAPGCKYVADIARKMGRNESTVRRWIRQFGIEDEVRAAMLYGAQEVEEVRAWKPFVQNPQSARAESEPVPDREYPRPEIVGAGPNVEPDIDQIRQSAEARFAAKANRAEQKRHQRVRFPHGPVAIFFVGDQHLGNAGTDVARVFAEQKAINATPGAYVWQMGDLIDNFVMGRLMAENMKPSAPVWEQWQLARHYMGGFGDRVLAYCGGNHEAWTLMLSGVDYRRDICPEGVLYDGDDLRATVSVGHHDFRVWSRHKWRGSSIYSQTHGQERAARFSSARYDVYVGAHTHTGAVAREFTLDGSRKLAIQTGSYKRHDDYAVNQGFPDHDASTACALVLHDDGSFFACSDLRATLNYLKAVYAA